MVGVPFVSIAFFVRLAYKQGKIDGYTDAVRDVIDTGKFKSVEEVRASNA
jgi:hypothetical protein